MSFLSSIVQWLSIIPGIAGILQAAGIKLPTPVGQAIQVITATDADVANYESGQAVVVAKIPQVEGNDPGYLIACKQSGPAAQSLGL